MARVRTARFKDPYRAHERLHRYRLPFAQCGNCGERQVFKYFEGHRHNGVERWCYVCGATNEATLAKPKAATGAGDSDSLDARLRRLTPRQLAMLLEIAERKDKQ